MSKPAPVHGHCDPRFRSIRDVFEKNLKAGLDLGASVAFTLNGELVVDLWGGHLEFDRKDEWQRDTLVNLYSTTKGMTAICAHRLLEQGKLDLDAPVAQYWPEFGKAGKEKLPVRYLLTHQAGLPALRKPLPKGTLYDWDRMTSALAEQEPWWEPGTKHGYHAMTFGFLVGELVRRVSGQSLGTYFREQVAEPLGADFHIGMRYREMMGAMRWLQLLTTFQRLWRICGRDSRTWSRGFRVLPTYPSKSIICTSSCL